MCVCTCIYTCIHIIRNHIRVQTQSHKHHIFVQEINDSVPNDYNDLLDLVERIKLMTITMMTGRQSALQVALCKSSTEFSVTRV